MERKQRRLLMVLAMTVAIGVAASSANAQMVASWQFEEGSGTVAKDLQGYGIDLILYGDTVYDADVPDELIGISTSSLLFDGTGDFGEVLGGAEPFLNAGGGPWTIMCWERTTTWTNNQTFMDKGNNYRIAGYSNDIEALIHVSGTPTYGTGGDLGDTDWHHVAASYDGNTMIAYIDGVSVGTYNVGGPSENPATTFRIGATSISWGSSFTGRIDDAAIFHEALDSTTINSLMENGITSFVNSNLAPYVDAGPATAMVIPQKPEPGPPPVYYDGLLELNGFAADNTGWPLGDPCGLTTTWSVLDKPLGGAVTFAAGPSNPQNTAVFPYGTALGIYRLVLNATDGILEANDYILVDLKHYTYTGQQNHWKFDDNLDDDATGTANTTDDYFESRGVLDPIYGPGVIGNAVHVGRSDGGGGWCWLETPFLTDSPDRELKPFFTVEMYINPTIELILSGTDQDAWQDLVGKWFAYEAGQYTHYRSYEFVVSYGLLGMNKTDISDHVNAIKDTNYYEAPVATGAHSFPRVSGWQHIAFVGDGGGGVDFYIDGERVGTGVYPEAEFVDEHAPLRIANVLQNLNGGVGRASPYVGWIDDLQFYEYNKPPSYMKERAQIIPIQSPTPGHGYQYVAPDVVLAWAPVKGFQDETPTYDVYFAQDGQPLTLAVAGLTDCSYDPEEAGPVADLNLDTDYIWKVVSNTSADDDPESAEWTFKTYAPDFMGIDGSALIAHWQLEETTGTTAFDSAGDNDEAFYHYPAVGDKDPPQWIPGWIAAAVPNKAIGFRSFEYFETAPVDINQYIDLPKDSYTLATWMKTTPAFIFDDGDFISFGNSYAIGRDETAQVVEYYHGDIAGSATSGVTPVGDGYWHHVAAVYEQPTVVKDTLVYLYIDGYLDATEAVNDNHRINITSALMLGANSGEANNFTGALDDVRIYRRALQLSEIKELFDMGIVNEPPTVDAGTNIIVPYPGLTVDIDTPISDDGAPLSGNPEITWEQTGGAGTVTFSPTSIASGAYVGWVNDVDNILTTTLTFSAPGYYKIKLKADDTIYDHSDEVRIWVQDDGAEGTTVAYWRYEEDTPETNYRGGGDDPNTLVIVNEVAGAPSLIADRAEPITVPSLHSTVMQSVVPLTGETNNYHVGEGPGNVNYFGNRLGTSGMSITMEAETWDGLVFCEDGITVECYIKLDEQNWTVYDMLDDGRGLRFFNTTAAPTNRLRFEFYVETDVPNQFRFVTVVSDILVYEMGWMHVAFTYDKNTGKASVYYNGVPAWLTHHNDGDGAGMVEYTPWVDHWEGEPGRTFVLQESLNLLVSTGVDTVPSGFDELRITAEPLWAQKLLVKGPAECAEKLQGDLDGDCDVDVYDLKLFCDSWLMCNNADPTECFK